MTTIAFALLYAGAWCLGTGLALYLGYRYADARPRRSDLEGMEHIGRLLALCVLIGGIGVLLLWKG